MLRKTIEEIRSENKQSIDSIRSENKQKIKELQKESKQSIEEIRSENKQKNDEVRSESKESIEELKEEIKILKSHIEKFQNIISVIRYDNRSYFHPLQIVSSQNRYDLVRYLIENCHCGLKSDNESERKDFFYNAIEHNNLPMLKYFVDKFQIDTKDRNDPHLLISAIRNKNMQIIRYLVEEIHVSLNYKKHDSYDSTRIIETYFTYCKDSPEIAKYLRSKGATEY